MGKVSLKNVLKSFLNHYEELEQSLKSSRTAVKELAESGRSTPPPLSLYAQEFLKLKELTESLKKSSSCPMIEGHSDVNKKKNRYKDILPYDNSRVILSEYPGVPGSDYINANYVKGSSGNHRAYIASQGPLPNTLVDFWRMIWETEVLVIVMACNEREAGKYKCESYWPENPDEKQQYGNITVEHVKWRQVCPDFLVRTFSVSADKETRTICQFHYTTWPDHGIPSSVQPILELVRLMRDVQSTESRPILVHCSAGCGRTGTLCSIDYVWALLKSGKLREDFSLFDIISDMRRQRIAMVQTVEQYMLCYRAVSTLFEQHLKLIDSHTYENVDDDGEPLGYKTDRNQENSENETFCEKINETSKASKETIEKVRKISVTPFLSKNLNELNTDENDQKEESQFSESNKSSEKVIGKATVIRKTSIAKLKAIFDNFDSRSNSNQEEMQKCEVDSSLSSKERLQRSQSIKENFRNFNFNFHLEINQPKLPASRKIKSHTLTAPKLNVYKRNFSFSNLAFSADKSFPNRTKITDISFDNQEDVSIKPNTNSDTHLFKNDRHQDSHGKMNYQSVISNENSSEPFLLSSSSKHHHQPNSSSDDSQEDSEESTNNKNAPPKPPRTYQHNNLVIDDSPWVVKTSEGRLIVTVAQPKSHHQRINESTNFVPIQQINVAKYSQFNQNNGAFIYEKSSSFAPKKYISSPNLNNLSQQLTQVPSNKPNQFSNQIYGGAVITSKPPVFSNRSMFTTIGPPNHRAQQANNHQMMNFMAYNNYQPLNDVTFGSHHFQHHQAKPFILHQPSNYFEPIYGTTSHPIILPQRSSLQQPNDYSGLPPPLRPRSISTNNFRAPPQSACTANNNIYSNRELTFNTNVAAINSQQAFTANFANNSLVHSVPPVAKITKENIYSEIQINPSPMNEQNNDLNNSNKKHKDDSKNGRLKKLKNAFKLFRLKSVPTGGIKTSQSVKNKTNKNPSNIIPNSSNSFKITNGMTATVPINPINGQPLTRPPHSHRFHPSTQWTQV